MNQEIEDMGHATNISLRGPYVREGTPPPESITIPKASLCQLLMLAREGMDPVVSFNLDNRVMLEDAYRLRGDRLENIERRLRAIINGVEAGS